jgi:hypothetical protein
MRSATYLVACSILVAMAAPVFAQTSESLGPATGTGDAGVITDPRSAGDAGGDLGPAQPTTQESPNPAGTLGGASPFERDSTTINEQTVQQDTLGEQQNMTTFPGELGPLRAEDIADWRMVQHNGRWWFWTPYERWLYYHNNNWVPYAPRQPITQRGEFQQRQRVGYRGDTRFDERANLDDGAVQGSTTFRSQADFDRRAGAAPGQFPAGRPNLPTIDELNRFRQQQFGPAGTLQPVQPNVGQRLPDPTGGTGTSEPAPGPRAVDGTAPTGGTGTSTGAGSPDAGGGGAGEGGATGAGPGGEAGAGGGGTSGDGG